MWEIVKNLIFLEIRKFKKNYILWIAKAIPKTVPVALIVYLKMIKKREDVVGT